MTRLLRPERQSGQREVALENPRSQNPRTNKSWHLYSPPAAAQCRRHRNRWWMMTMQAANNRADPDALLSEVQAADFLNLSVRTLQAWRIKVAGPRFVRAGRAIRYRRSDLIAWIDANTVAYPISTGAYR